MSSIATNDFHCYYLSETSVTVKFGDIIDDNLFEIISQFNKQLQQNNFTGFVTSVQAYTTLTVYYDPILVSKSDLRGETCYDKVVNHLNQLATAETRYASASIKKVTIPVCYDSKFGLDLADIAEHTKLAVADVIELHASAIYKVHMIGFVPGFAYLGGMDEHLSMPRKAIPRKAVPMGSVGIAGKQTGIYPLETPGGWQILGRTPLELFSLNREQASLLQPGDLVNFEPIDLEQFEELSQANHAD